MNDALKISQIGEKPALRIKKLELIGFKSFKDRTVIQFDEGITGIVGPNGCGKSNIVDALVWVMGEMSAKHLRGSAMSDVIFAGAENYSPVGMAEVSLTLENDGGPFPVKYMRFSEVMVTRRLHRSGESEYFINKEPARLRDIQEIFMDTGAGSKGFSIIEQGAIGKIITAKPEERRTLIEEAAGITKFKVRKKESQRKLIQTDQNLVRLQDIIGEQKRQLSSLERQAQRADRYRRLKTELEGKELWLTSHQYLSIHEETEIAQKVFSEAQESEVSASSGLTEKRVQLEGLKAENSEKEMRVSDSQQAYQEVHRQLVEKENQIRELKFEIEQARRNKEMTGGIVEQQSVRKEALDKELKALELKQTQLQEDVEALSQNYDQKNEVYQGISQRIQNLDVELTEKRRKLLTLAQSESHLDARLISLESSCEEAEQRCEKERESFHELETKREEFSQIRKKVFNKLEKERQLKLDITRDVETLETNLQDVTQKMEDRQKEVETYKDELNEVASRLYGLEDLHANFEGFQEGVKNVMLWKRQQVEVHADGSSSTSLIEEFQPVAEVVEVPVEYELAMESALGQKLQMLLSQNSGEVLGAVDYLKQNQSGRSSFLSADLISRNGENVRTSLDASQEGFIANLQDVVSIPEKFKAQVSPLLDSVVVVESIRAALKLRPQFPTHTFVTQEGDTLTSDGVLTGGTSESAQSGVLKRRREIKDLSQKREELAGKLSLAQLSLEKMQAQVKGLRVQVQEAQKQQVEKEVQIAELKKDLERAEGECEAVQRAYDSQMNRLQVEEQKLLTFQANREETSQRILEIREEKVELESTVEALTEEFKTSREGIDQLQEEVSQLRVDLASQKQALEGIHRHVEMTERSLADINTQLNEMSEEKEKSTQSLSLNQILLEEAQVELESLIRISQENEEAVSIARNEYEIQARVIRELESAVTEILQGMNSYQTRMNEAQLKLEQLKMKEQYLWDQVHERYMKDLREIASDYKDVPGEIEFIQIEVEDIKGKLQRIGEVNLSAIQEYDELIERNSFLNQQHEDLLTAKDQLRKVIERINRICTRRFSETFEQVNERFIKVFPVLFGGGEARLVLIENEEKGEAGIDIIARPPGKKAANVSLLSGGEKALTAVSLIFSIFLVKPSPFCLLDEVDAPLDDANVFRFNDLVKEMAKRSQIIIVTHNKHTMKVNNKLFGVTQEEKGVSKMVSVSLDEAMVDN